MREVMVSVYHYDCVGCKTSEKFPEVRMGVSPVVYLEKKNDGSGTFAAIWGFRGGKLADAKKAFDYARGLESTKKASILSSDSLGITAYMVIEAQNTVLDRIMASNCIPLRPVHVEEELEHWQVITENTKNVSELIDNLSGIGDVRVRGIRNFKPDKKPSGLTRKQLDALMTAAECGYYEWPRKLSLEEISIKTRKPRSTLQTHLRKAESKVISSFLAEIGRKQSFLL